MISRFRRGNHTLSHYNSGLLSLPWTYGFLFSKSVEVNCRLITLLKMKHRCRSFYSIFSNRRRRPYPRRRPSCPIRMLLYWIHVILVRYGRQIHLLNRIILKFLFIIVSRSFIQYDSPNCLILLSMGTSFFLLGRHYRCRFKNTSVFALVSGAVPGLGSSQMRGLSIV